MNIESNRKRSPPPVEMASAPEAKSCTYHSWDIRVFPRELVVKIFANLDACDLLVCTQVSRHWQTVIVTESTIAKVFFRCCRPSEPTLPSLTALPRSPATLIPWQSYYRCIRDWLKGFNEQGRQVVLRLDQGLEPVGQRFPEQLFINVANLLGQPKGFHGQELLTIEHADKITDIYFSPDEQHLALVCWDHPIKIYSCLAQQWQEVPINPQSDNITCANFSPNSQALVILSEYHRCEIWGLVGNRWQKNTDITYTWQLPSFSAQTQYLATINSNNKAKIYQLVDGQWQPQTTALDNCPAIRALFNPVDNHLLATRYQNTVNIWRCINGQWQHNARLPYRFYQHGLYFSPDGRRLLTDSVELVEQARQCTVCIWHSVDGVWQQEAVVPLPRPLWVAHFSSIRDSLVTLLSYQDIKLWQLSANQWQEVPLPEHAPLCTGALSADGQRLAIHPLEGQARKTASVWRFAGEQWHEEVRIRHTAPVNDIHFSCHGNHVVTGSDDKTAKIYGYIGGTWEEKATLAHAARVTCARFSPFGRYVLTQTRGKAKIMHLWMLNAQGR